MNRQQGERLAEKIKGKHPEFLVDLYRDGGRERHWITRVFNPETGDTRTFQGEMEAMEALRHGDPRIRVTG